LELLRISDAFRDDYFDGRDAMDALYQRRTRNQSVTVFVSGVRSAAQEKLDIIFANLVNPGDEKNYNDKAIHFNHHEKKTRITKSRKIH
jgi:hypothetical protein